MDFITVIVIGLVIYSFIKKVKQRSQPGSSMPMREMFSGRDSKFNELRKMFDQLYESQNPKQIIEKPVELTQALRYDMSPDRLSTEGEQGVEGLWGEEGTQGIEGTSGNEGTQGIEGTPGNEGIQGIEGTSGIEGIQGMVYTSKKEAVPRTEETLSIRSNFGKNKVWTGDIEEELLQGIIWAEVLGRPRALRHYRAGR